MWEYVVAALLALHGAAHLTGFMGTWRLGPFMEGDPVALPFGRTDSGSLARTLGLLWIGGMVLFVTTAVGAVVGAIWWPALLAVSAAASLALCVMWWKDARIGAAIDLVILAGLGLARSLSLAA